MDSSRSNTILSRVLQFTSYGWPDKPPEDPAFKPFWTRKLELSTQDGVVVPIPGRLPILDWTSLLSSRCIMYENTISYVHFVACSWFWCQGESEKQFYVNPAAPPLFTNGDGILHRGLDLSKFSWTIPGTYFSRCTF